MPTAPDSAEPVRPAKRGGRMSELASVEETAVWLEVNGRPAVTWMCTPELLEELAVGWLHGEGYIDRSRKSSSGPAPPISASGRRYPTSAWPACRPRAATCVGLRLRGRLHVSSGTSTVEGRPLRGMPPAPERLRALFKALFARGERYKDTGGIHAAALVEVGDLRPSPSGASWRTPRTSAATTRWTSPSAARSSPAGTWSASGSW